MKPWNKDVGVGLLRMVGMALASGLLFPLAGFSQTLHFGTNLVTFGEVTEFRAPLNTKARWELNKAGGHGNYVDAALLLPVGFDLRKPWPLLIVSVPSGGRSIPMLRAYTNVALSLGYAIFAADGPRVAEERDSVQYGWAMLSVGLEHLVRTWPQAKSWPMTCAGFSGGAKRSAAVGAAMVHDGYRVSGVFMGGCNEDRTTLGMWLFLPGERFKAVPMFLSNGLSDPIAGPDYGEGLKQFLLRNGFTNVRAATYEGGHKLDEKTLKAALEWFKGSSQPRTQPAKIRKT